MIDARFPIGNMNFSTPSALGAAIRQARKRLGVTQKDLALAAGTGLRFIGELENGKATCHWGKVFDVLEALGLAIRVEPR